MGIEAVNISTEDCRLVHHICTKVSTRAAYLASAGTVLPKHTLFKVLYFILAKFKNYTLFILFLVKYFKNTLLQDKIVYKDQKYFIYTFFLKYLIRVGSLSTNYGIKNFFDRTFFKPCHSKFMIFHAKIGILGKNLYVSHTSFEGNHTLFGEKLYFIWKFSSGNTEVNTVTQERNEIEISKLMISEYGLISFNFLDCIQLDAVK